MLAAKALVKPSPIPSASFPSSKTQKSPESHSTIPNLAFSLRRENPQPLLATATNSVQEQQNETPANSVTATPGQLRVDILSESLSFIQKFRGKTIVVKYGGAAMKSAQYK
ncbi:hypothetical protein L484_017586 [Morus notabilis]|uniref:Aspartate/glutamate/uridylate kinase domain-containing protein n=1 Tax=Morus notabilis TaxID=981085 RepID=W9RN91_9ROSA|nr:hypothetical protein L484_017586 [Morus notabilis]